MWCVRDMRSNVRTVCMLYIVYAITISTAAMEGGEFLKNFGELDRRRCERGRWILSTAFKKDIGRRTAADSEMRA